MTLDSPIRFWVAADDNEAWRSSEKRMSLRFDLVSDSQDGANLLRT